MNSELMQANDWLKAEIKRDELDIKTSKKRYIKEITSIDKRVMLKSLKKKKKSLLSKIIYILGYGNKK